MSEPDVFRSGVDRRTITRDSDEWPERLSEIGPLDPPVSLTVDGRHIQPDAVTVAIVGTRRPTVAGIEVAERMARELAQAGWVVVSGLAAGIDAAAHRGCLAAGGHTIAVVGCGLGVNYPRTNRRLREEIAACGTVISEYDTEMPVVPHQFPRRNRIVAGLAHAVVVVEGGPRSGSLITARIALDAGREVFAVPGSARNAMADAPNELIRTSQAALATSAEHVFEAMAPGQAWSGAHDPSCPATPSVDDEEAPLLMALDDVPAPPDRLITATGLDIGKLSMLIARLEVRGLARRTRLGYEITATGARTRAGLVEDGEER